MSKNSTWNLRNLTILLGSTTTVLAATIISPSLPGMAAEFAHVPHGEFLVRLSLTMPALFIALGAVFIGPLLDRLGRKPVLVASLTLYAVAGTAGFFLTDLTLILVSRAFLGIAVAGVMSGFTTLILDYFRGNELNKFLGLQGAFIGLGGMVFLLMAGFLADIGWKYPFLIHLFALPLLPAVMISISEPDITIPGVDSNTPKANFPWSKLTPLYATAFIGMVIFFIFPVQLPFYLTDVSSSQIGIALSANTLTSVFIALFYQRLKARYSFQAVFVIIFLMFAINHIVLAFSSSYILAIIGLLIGGIGIGLLPPHNAGWLAALTPFERRGQAVGGLTSALFLGQFFSPILTQPLITRAGFVSTFGIAAGVAFLVALIFGLGAARQKNHNAAVQPINQ